MKKLKFIPESLFRVFTPIFCQTFFLMTLMGMICSVIAVQSTFAGSLKQIKQNMRQRLPVIVRMKHQGIIGENSRGYLEFVTGKKTNQKIVADENKDRKTIYAMIAKQQGVSIAKVEKLRGLQIVKKAGKGEYLKEKNGTWYRK